MIYATKESAMAMASELNKFMLGWGTHCAARIADGWTVRRVSPYSNGDVIEWAKV